MKKRFLTLILISIIFVFSNAIITAEDDPFADMGVPGEPGFDMGADDPLAGMEAGADDMGSDPLAGMGAGAEDAGSDPLAGMDAGAEDMGSDPLAGMDAGAEDAGSDPLAGMEAGSEDMTGIDSGADPFGDMGMDAGADTAGSADVTDMGADNGADPFGGDDMFGGTETGMQQAPVEKAPAVKKAAAPRKTGPVEITAVPRAGGMPRTNEVYTGKDRYLGDFPNLKDQINYRMRASSYLNEENNPEKMSDVMVDSAWVEKKITGGKGESVIIDFEVGSFSGVYEGYSRAAKVKEIRFLSGNCKSREEWENSYRPMRLKLKHNNKVIAYINLRDTMNWQTASFKSPITVREGDVLKAEFEEVYPAVRRENDRRVAITEIALIGDYE